MPSIVREEFGPTLPELLAGRGGRSVRWWSRALIGALAVALLVGLAAKLAQREAAAKTGVVVTGGAFPFNLAYDEARLQRVDPEPGERLRLTQADGVEPFMRVVVREQAISGYRGDAAGFMPLYASTVTAAMEADDPAFQVRGEARARINDNPGYQISFITKLDGRTVYGKRFFLYDDPDDTEATINRPTAIADLTLLSGYSKAVTNPNAVGGNGALKTPLRSFRFGDQRP